MATDHKSKGSNPLWRTTRNGQGFGEWVDFEVGDRVEITNGAFKNSEGVIEAMDEEKKEATVLLILFGRETPTEIPYMDLKKVD